MIRRLRRRRTGALPLLALLLFASVVLRLGGGTGQAIAREMGDLRAMDIAGAAICEPPEDVTIVLAALDARETRILEQETQIALRQSALAEAEVTIKAQLVRLREAEAGLQRMLELADGAAEDDLARLTSVYENMKPREAAALFGEMAPQFAAGFLGRMRPDAAARIMAGLEPAAAYSISVMLAGRNADLPDR